MLMAKHQHPAIGMPFTVNRAILGAFDEVDLSKGPVVLGRPPGCRSGGVRSSIAVFAFIPLGVATIEPKAEDADHKAGRKRLKDRQADSQDRRSCLSPVVEVRPNCTAAVQDRCCYVQRGVSPLASVFGCLMS
jgi:hypothetical protein